MERYGINDYELYASKNVCDDSSINADRKERHIISSIYTYVLPITFGWLVAAARGPKKMFPPKWGFYASHIATYIHVIRVNFLSYPY